MILETSVSVRRMSAGEYEWMKECQQKGGNVITMIKQYTNKLS